MDARRLATILVAGLNSLTEEIEKEISADKDGGDKGDDSDGKASRGRERPSRAGRGRDEPARGRGKSDDDDDDPKTDDGDEPTEADIVKAARAALKVIEQDDVKAIIKKHGKAERATEVKPERRQAVIDALEKAVDEAD